MNENRGVSDIPKWAISRSVKLASLPLGVAGRGAIGLGKRIGGRPAEIVATEIARNALVIVGRRERELAHVVGFEVFEKKSFHDDEVQREPRELVCADVDGDRKADLAILVHDKLIVYFQE